MTDHALGHRERLRARFLKGDTSTLPDYEILEMILFGAKPRGDVKPLAKTLLKTFGSLKNVLQADVEKLKAVEGMGDASVVSLKVILEASCRLLYEEAIEAPILNQTQKVIDYCRSRMEGLEIEQFRLLFLDRKNKLIGDEVQQHGTIDHTPIFPREVVKRALEKGAGAIIMVHNHPSGDPTPSQADIDITNKVIKAARPLDIRIHDHIIIGRLGYTSLRERGLI